MSQYPIILENLNSVLAENRANLILKLRTAEMLRASLKLLDGKQLNKRIATEVQRMMPDHTVYYDPAGQLSVWGGPSGSSVQYNDALRVQLKGMPENEKRLCYDHTYEVELKRQQNGQELLDSITEAQRNAPALVARYNAALEELSAATAAFGRARYLIPDTYRVRRN